MKQIADLTKKYTPGTLPGIVVKEKFLAGNVTYTDEIDAYIFFQNISAC